MMRATRSGIVIGLALALLLPAGVAGQETSPTPAVEPGSAALTEAECVPPSPPEEGTVEAELEALVTKLDGQVAAVLDQLDGEDDPAKVIAAIEELAGQIRTFGKQVVGRLDLPDGTTAAAAAVHRATKSDADDLLGIIGTTSPPADAPEFTLPATSAALSGLRTALGLPAPCPTSDATGTRVADAAGASQAVALKSIEDLLATEMQPQGHKAIRIAIETAYATDSSAAASAEWNREEVLDVVDDTGCPKDPECVSLVAPLFAMYIETGNPLFFTAAEMVWASTLRDDALGEARAADLRESFPGA